MKKTVLNFTLLLLILSLCLFLFGCEQEENNSQKNIITEIQPQPTENNALTTPGNDETISIPNVTGEQDLDIQDPTEAVSDPTTPDTTNPSLQPTEPSEIETTSPANPTEPQGNTPDVSAEAYANYHKMSGEEQQKFIDSFGSIEAFFDWLNAAKKAYEENRTPIDGFTPIIP